MTCYDLLDIVHLLIDKSLLQNIILENTDFHKTKNNFYHNVKVLSAWK